MQRVRVGKHSTDSDRRGDIMETYEEDDLSKCTRCEEMVGTETLVRLLDWSVCETCWGDI